MQPIVGRCFVLPAFALHAIGCLVLALLITAAAPRAQAQEKAVAEIMRNIIEGAVPTIGIKRGDKRFLSIFELYASHHYTPIWVRDTGPKFKAKHFLGVLKRAHDHGLAVADYRLGEIEKRMAARDYQTLAELEFLLTRALMEYARDINAGRVDPTRVHGDVDVYPEVQASAALLERIDKARQVFEVLDTLAPQTPRYARMKKILKAYRGIAARGGWPEMPPGETLKPGMRSDRVPVLRALMFQMTDLVGPAAQRSNAAARDLYDRDLVAAVKRFQARHGIDRDGVIGPGTLEAMNTPIAQRIRAIELNMERRRWMQNNYGPFYVFVNLADQVLKVVRDIRGREKTLHTARLVVGKPFHKSPVFSKDMTYLEINPFWNVPRSIALKELLPNLRKDANALRRQNIRVLQGWGDQAPEIDPLSVDWRQITPASFRYRFRQDAGDRNALGRIKFMFPNRFDVYIHDTPSKSLFNRTSRFFSHGCMRVENPRALAVLLLRETGTRGWPRRRIDQTIASDKRKVVKFANPVAVHITYLTAWVNKDMTVHFRKDVYGRDKRLDQALKRSVGRGQ